MPALFAHAQKPDAQGLARRKWLFVSGCGAIIQKCTKSSLKY